MKKKIIFTMFGSLAIMFCLFNTAHAALSINTTVDVPESCTAIDTDGVTHSYGGTSYLAICALEAAVNNGSISGSDLKLSNQYPSIGLFITSINGVTADPSTQYWAIYQNGTSANLGVAELPVSAGDTILFELDDFSGNNQGDQVTLNINSLSTTPAPASGGGQLYDGSPTPPVATSSTSTTTNTSTGSGSSSATPSTPTPPTPPTFDVNKALDFLTSQQKDDGSFGSDLYTDWTALALASSPNSQSQIIKLIKYYEGEQLISPSLTDYERHAIAIMSLGLNPYDTNGENYINDIVKSFDGKQFGDPNQDNDDIFALIVLQNAGYTENDGMVNTDINFILSTQNTDGSWDGSVDMTGAAMEALSAFNTTLPTSPTSGGEEIQNALSKGENYLEQSQKDDGGWNENASSTAWAIEGILAQNEKPENWSKNTISGIIGNTPLDYLATIQDTDGGVKDSDINNKIWETSYVVTALSGKTWNQIIQTFPKGNLPAPVINSPTPVTTPALQTGNTNVISMKTTENKIAKIENTANQNTANVLNAIPSPTPTPSKNWFVRLLEKIF